MSWLSNSQSISAKAYNSIESFDLPFWQFWRFLLIGSEMDISSSRERFRILIWNIKMPNRCLDLWGSICNWCGLPIRSICGPFCSRDHEFGHFSDFGNWTTSSSSGPDLWPKGVFTMADAHIPTPDSTSNSIWFSFSSLWQFFAKTSKIEHLNEFPKTYGRRPETYGICLAENALSSSMRPLEIHEDKDLR